MTPEALRERATKLGHDLARYPTVQWTERILANFIALVAGARAGLYIMSPTSCRCGGTQAWLRYLPSGAEEMVGCVCHTFSTDAIAEARDDAAIEARDELMEVVSDIVCLHGSGDTSHKTPAELLACVVKAIRAEARREQIERFAFLLEPTIYDLAQYMAERGLFVRDDFGEPAIAAIRELVAGLAAALRAQETT